MMIRDHLNGRQPKPLDSAPAIVLRDIKARHTGEEEVVLNIPHLTIQRGERVAFIGPSGAGKTSLLRLINGYLQPEAGRLTILGQPMDAAAIRQRDARRRVGFVFQNFNLVERATVFENVLWGRLGRVQPLLSALGYFSKADKQAAMRAIHEVDLAPQARQRADTLSGGQQQRVAVARVLAQEAEIILADEPVSNLDPALADDILGLLVEVSRRHGATLLMSVHQPSLAQRHAERIVGLRQGQVVYDNRAGALSGPAVQAIYGRAVQLESLESPSTPSPAPAEVSA